MSKRVWISIALVAAIALAAAAVPALSADSGTMAVSITAQAPAAPCLTVAPGSVDFGTLPFSTDNAGGISRGNAEISFDFCGTATSQNLLGSTTSATGASGSWTPRNDGGSIQPCPEPNQFYLSTFEANGFPGLYMTGTPAPVLGAGGVPAAFPHGTLFNFLTIRMPCQGSNGPGETKTLTVTFTAVLP